VSLERDPAKARAWEQRSRQRAAERAREKPRKQLPRESAKRKAGRAERDRVREAVFRRDGHRCQLLPRDPEHRCWGPLTFHHLRKASAGGGYTEENGLTLCAGGNTWVEDHPDRALELGLVIR
jgi:5-methylcytosine-specific restriction endonuclease McrA